MQAKVLAYWQYLVPRHWMTALVYRLSRVRHRGFKNFLIDRFVRLYKVETAEVRLQVPDDFDTFNAFFIRELRPDARPVDPAPGSIVSPVDGRVSQAGRLFGGTMVQAKGIDYALNDLLATNIDEAQAFVDGLSATIYLAPYDYHRVHAPFAGELVGASYVPGDLFSVNDTTVRAIRGLFRRNERLVLNFRLEQGPAAVILVGALNVGSITTPWTGELRPRRKGMIENFDLGSAPVTIEKGELLGWFNMGSTVIVLLPKGAASWHDSVSAGAVLRMGESIGALGPQ